MNSEAAASKAVRVVLYEDRAEVVRVAKVSLAAGAQWIAVGGITPLVDDLSVQAGIDAPGARVLAARVRRRVVQETEVGHEEIEWLEDSERAARRKVIAADHGSERSEAAASRLTTLLEGWRRGLAQVPADAREEAVARWKESYASLVKRSADAALEQFQARLDQEDTREALARAKALLAQGRTTRPLCEAAIEVQVEALKPVDAAELRLTYRTPCALWRPEHLARLVTEADGAKAGKMEIVTWATVWQSTGERWEDVEAVLSTARPARAATPPLLSSDVLASRRKTEQEKQSVSVELRDQAIALAGELHGAHAPEEMPGVDDGGLPLSFTTTSPMTLPSDGLPLRVEINRMSVDASVSRVLLPERSPVAHYRATATLLGSVPLLAGPLQVARGSGLSGRSRIDFVAPGEPFSIGFGPDDALRVRRTVDSKTEVTPLTGTRKIERRVRLFLSNLSDREKEVEVTERIPVSEIGEVELTLVEAPGLSHDKGDGFLRAMIAVAPLETKELLVQYEIRAKSNVRLPF